jgi:hypothetical protein
MCDDAFFIASCMNETKCDEIQWFTTKEHVTSGTHISKFQGYIGFINGTFIEIPKF